MKIASVFFMLLIALSCRAGTFIDDFEDGDLEGWRQVNPASPMLWKVVDGKLECTRQSSESAVLVTGEDNWRDYTIEFDFMLMEDFGSGDIDIAARYTMPVWSSVMLFYIGDFFGPSEIGVQRYPGPVNTREAFAPLELDKWYHIKLEAEGSDFILWLDDEEALNYDDKTPESGSIGLGLANYKARFDNVIITGPDVPDVTPVTWKGQPVQPRGRLATNWAKIRAN